MNGKSSQSDSQDADEAVARSGVKAGASRRHHLVVVHQHYLTAMLAGKKRIECRLSRLRKPPFEAVATGDVLWLKPPSRPICAMALVGDCRFRELKPGEVLADVVAPYVTAIAADARFFDDAEPSARFLSLISLTKVVSFAPIPVMKRDQRAWVVLDGPVRPGMRVDSTNSRY